MDLVGAGSMRCRNSNGSGTNDACGCSGTCGGSGEVVLVVMVVVLERAIVMAMLVLNGHSDGIGKIAVRLIAIAIL